MTTDKTIALLEVGNGWSMWVKESQLPFRVGRKSENDLIHESLRMSRSHCVIEIKDNILVVSDCGSKHGTVVGDRLVKDGFLPIEKRSCILFGDVMLWITPSKYFNSDGLIKSEETKIDAKDAHGILLFDICDSTEFSHKIVDGALGSARGSLIGWDHERILLLKHTGDGYLAIFDNPVVAISSAERLLKWQRERFREYKLDVRVTVEAGPTFPASGNDRLGLAINRAARIEKTQESDLELRGKQAWKLKSRNRCLSGATIRRTIPSSLRQKLHYIGKRQLKGFGTSLFSIYQISFDRKPALTMERFHGQT